MDIQLVFFICSSLNTRAGDDIFLASPGGLVGSYICGAIVGSDCERYRRGAGASGNSSLSS